MTTSDQFIFHHQTTQAFGLSYFHLYICLSPPFSFLYNNINIRWAVLRTLSRGSPASTQFGSWAIVNLRSTHRQRPWAIREGDSLSSRCRQWQQLTPPIHPSLLSNSSYRAGKDLPRNLSPQNGSCSCWLVLPFSVQQRRPCLSAYLFLHAEECKSFALKAFEIGNQVFGVLHKPYAFSSFAAEAEEWHWSH